MKLANHRRNVRGAFSIWDLIAVLIVVAFLAVWFVYDHTGEHARIARCTRNLKDLGEATQSFASDHDGNLPAALINLGQLDSWDMELTPYLASGTAKGKSAYDKEKVAAQAMPLFCCPSDPIKRTKPRSYAMSGRYMPYGWPPSADDNTGVGLFWDPTTVAILDDPDLEKNAITNPDLLPLIKQSMLPDPANTLLLTELIKKENSIQRSIWTRVFSASDQH